MARTNPKIGQAELEVLHYVANHHPIRVSDVAQHFSEATGKARTTVLTVMERLRAKGYLKRKQIGGAWQYSPKFSKPTLMRTLVHKFVHESLDGSLEPFLAYLADSGSLSDDEFEQLKQLVEDLEAER
jgi:predicted transcriptional regulator